MKQFVNSITLIRLFMTFLLPYLWSTVNPIIVFVLVGFILLTDFFDGMLARKFHVQTLFGCLADIVADKVFGIVLVIIIIISGDYPIFYFFVFFECLIALMMLSAAFLGAVTKSSFIGKCKMWLLGIAIMFGILGIFSQKLMNVINAKWMITLLKNFIINRELIINTSVLIATGAEIMVTIDYARHIAKDLKQKKEKIHYNFKKGEELYFALFDTEYYLKNKNQPLSKVLLKIGD